MFVSMINYFIDLGTIKLLNYLIKFSLEHGILPLFVLKTVELLYQLQLQVVLLIKDSEIL
jgi:hypothetical protein